MSVNSSWMLPTPLRTTSVNPEIVVIVVADVTTVVPNVGARYPAGGADHSSPDAVAELTESKYPLVEATVNSAGVDAPLAARIEPLAVSMVF